MIHSNLCSTKFSRIVSTGRIRITILLERWRRRRRRRRSKRTSGGGLMKVARANNLSPLVRELRLDNDDQSCIGNVVARFEPALFVDGNCFTGRDNRA